MKLVDAGDSKSPAARRAGSIPAPGTTDKAGSFHELPAFFFFCGEMGFGWHVTAARECQGHHHLTALAPPLPSPCRSAAPNSHIHQVTKVNGSKAGPRRRPTSFRHRSFNHLVIWQSVAKAAPCSCITRVCARELLPRWQSAPMLSEAMKLLTWGDGMTHPA